MNNSDNPCGEVMLGEFQPVQPWVQVGTHAMDATTAGIALLEA